MAIDFKAKLAALLAAKRERAKLEQELISESLSLPSISEPPDPSQVLDKYGKLITLNSKQLEFVTLASTGQSCVLIGAAGTGKTTCQGASIQGLIQSGKAGILDALDHKHLPTGTPGVVVCAYTRRAVANIRRALPTDLQANCLTIHKLLEYEPVYNEVTDDATGDSRTKMSFEPNRDSSNPLPPSIHTIIFEEASMIGTDLYQKVINALSHEVQIIFLGDIQQLPPVFGPAILGFKLLELPVVELTDVYRQALESPIISLAHRILSGKGIEKEELSSWKHPGKLTLHPWKKRISADDALYTAGQFFVAAEKGGIYDPEEDIILIPYNKAFGTDELNLIIANHLARKKGSVTSQVIAGFKRHYFSIGDKVLYDKEDGVILDIYHNPAYSGAQPLPASTSLDYWGHDPEVKALASLDDDSVDFLLSQVASDSSSGEDRVRQASHTIKIQMLDSEREVTISKAAEINNLSLGYAITVHKSQGSEWRKVFFVLHQSHATMVSRELLYTGVTRAREELYVICESDTFVKGIASQRVKGNTLAEKAEYFKGKLEVFN